MKMLMSLLRATTGNRLLKKILIINLFIYRTITIFYGKTYTYIFSNYSHSCVVFLIGIINFVSLESVEHRPAGAFLIFSVESYRTVNLNHIYINKNVR